MPARRRCCGRSLATCRRSTASIGVRPPGAARATSPSCATPRSRARRCSTRSLEAIPVDARRGARLPRPLPVPRRRRVQGGPLAVGRRAVAARARPARASCRRTCCCSTSRRTTSTSRPARRSRRSSPSRRPRWSSCRTTGGCWRRSASGCGSSTTALAVPFDGGYRAWRQAVADGWTVEAEARRRANRLRPGPARPARPRSRTAATSVAAAHAEARQAATGPGAAARAASRSAPATDDRRAHEGAAEAVQGRLPPPARGRSTPSCPGSGCARASSSWRWAPRRSPPTSSRCAGSRASSPTSSARWREAEDAWLELEDQAP